jgi:hypothetical protein
MIPKMAKGMSVIDLRRAAFPWRTLPLMRDIGVAALLTLLTDSGIMNRYSSP